MAAVRILGIDPGLRNMGWGVIESEGSKLSFVACGTVKSNDKLTLADRLCQLFDGLSEVVHLYQPHEASVEETFVNKDARATLKLGQARGIAMLVPARAGLLVAESAPNLVKKSIVGTGHADKQQIHRMVKMLLPKADPKTPDAADALALALTHAQHRTRPRLVQALG